MNKSEVKEGGGGERKKVDGNSAHSLKNYGEGGEKNHRSRERKKGERAERGKVCPFPFGVPRKKRD